MLSKPLNKKIILPKSKDILSQMGSVVSLIASIYFFLWVNINKQLVTFKSSLHKNRNVLYLNAIFSPPRRIRNKSRGDLETAAHSKETLFSTSNT